MKKLKVIFCTFLLSTSLVGNVFASNSLSNGVFSFFDNAIETILSFTGEEDCKPRQCQTCKPIDVLMGKCRPTEE